jgi:hypothetical protein
MSNNCSPGLWKTMQVDSSRLPAFLLPGVAAAMCAALGKEQQQQALET